MTRELDGIELGQRVAVPLELENQPATDQCIAWVTYLAILAELGRP
jgi:hypothetical protein